MAEKEFGVILQAKNLVEHTFRITSNCNRYPKKYRFSLNGKTQIVPFKNGILFTGFHHYVTKDGKYIQKLNGANKRKIRKKLRAWAKLVNNGKMTKQKFYEKYGALKNHMLHGNCVKLCHSTDVYVEELLNKSSKIRRNKYG